MARSKEISIVHGILNIMWDNGWGEDAKHYVEYNDSRDIDALFANCLAETDRSKLDQHAERFQWDEEYNLKYEDEGVCSIVQQLGALFRKHQLIEVPKETFKVKVKRNTSVTYSTKCPACATTARFQFDPIGEQKECNHCGAKWEMEKTYD